MNQMNECKKEPYPKWNVFFERRVVGNMDEEPAKSEIPINKTFMWANDMWQILSLYPFQQGIAIDVCKQIEPTAIRTFLDKWHYEDNDLTNISDEEMELMTTENPTDEDFIPQLQCDGIAMQWSSTSATGWNPLLKEIEENSLDAAMTISHYSLSPESGWLICRLFFLYPNHSLAISSKHDLTLTLTQRELPVHGPHFCNLAVGDQISFINPTTKIMHTLKILDIIEEQLSNSNLRNQCWIIPTNVMRLNYSITPDLPKNSYQIRDCSHGDAPIERKLGVDQKEGHSSSNFASSVILAASDGPTSIFVAGKDRSSSVHTAYSSVYFEANKNIEWRMVFKHKIREDIQISFHI